VGRRRPPIQLGLALAPALTSCLSSRALRPAASPTAGIQRAIPRALAIARELFFTPERLGNTRHELSSPTNTAAWQVPHLPLALVVRSGAPPVCGEWGALPLEAESGARETSPPLHHKSLAARRGSSVIGDCTDNERAPTASGLCPVIALGASQIIPSALGCAETPPLGSKPREVWARGFCRGFVCRSIPSGSEH
jgi:hypothetical protein